jgi:iron complex transport system substrate-binding protein
MPVVRFISIVVLIAFTIACGDTAARRDSAPAIRDDFGVPIDFGRPPSRIVSLNPTTTELFFALGAGSRLVGRTTYDVYPDSARAVHDLGAGIRPNVEAILGVHPDLVVLYASSDNRPAAEKLRAGGIAVVGFKIDSIEQFRRDTRLLGRLIGDTVRAARVVDSVTATLERVRAATASLPRPTVFIHAWNKPIIAIAGGSFMSQLVDIAGGRNVYDSVSLPAATVTLEDVVARDPQYVLASPRELEAMRASASWRTVRAVREGRILAYDTNLFARPSVKLGMAARSIAELLHPGAIR